MPDQKATLEYATPSLSRRGPSILLQFVKGVLFAYLVVQAIIGIVLLIGYALSHLELSVLPEGREPAHAGGFFMRGW
jgi:hypothetical protein